jgi:glycosyltransferase involved in cell wall biosynthesis
MMSELYRVADALLFPSAQEGFGLPILEAGLARLPIFCANIQPFRELGESDVTLFELDAEPEDVAAQMLASLSHRAESRLRRRVSREFDWDIIFERQLRPLVDDVATQKADASRGYSHA